MENRKVKLYSRESNQLALHVIPGHFATSYSHINYYVDVTSIKTRLAEAQEAARVLYARMPRADYVDTIVCVDRTEVMGAFLGEQIQKSGTLSTNRHETVYVVSPEVDEANQMVFCENIKNAIAGKHIVLLLGTSTTGETIQRSLDCIRENGGIVESVASIFGTVKEVDGVNVECLFDSSDVEDYAAYEPSECPFCQKKEAIEAFVNGFGYVKY